MKIISSRSSSVSGEMAAQVTFQNNVNLVTPYKASGLAHEFSHTAMEELLDLREIARAKNIKEADAVSINMVPRYLKFASMLGKPQRLFFAGWTLRPRIDYKTKEPIVDENGQQLFGPAVLFYDEEKDQMFLNQASELTRCFHSMQPKKGDMFEVTLTGTEQLGNGNNLQTFKVIVLE